MVLRRLVVLLGIVSALAIVAGTGYAIWRARAAAVERAEERLADLALVLAEQTARAISEVASILTAAAETSPVGAPELGDRLRAHALVPQIRTLAAFDASGRLLAWNRDSPAPTLEAVPRDYLQVHLDRAVAGAYVSAPFTGRVTGQPTVAVSLGVRRAGGELTGVMVAFLNLAYFTDLYDALNLGPDGGVRLFHRNGVLLAGDPERSPLATSQAQRDVAPGNGVVVRVEELLPGVPGFAAVRTLRRQPLVLVVRSTAEHVLAPWRREAWTTAGLGAFAAALVLALTLAIDRRVAADERLRAGLRAAQGRLAAIVSSAMDAIITVDGSRRVVLFNAAAEKVFGCSAADAVGAPLDRFLPERFRAAHAQHIDRFARTGETSRRMGQQSALRALRANGTEFPIEASISHARAGDQELLTVILRDISDRAKAEQALREAQAELRELAQAMHEVREAERTRIARELHDELGQALTALKMDVDLLSGTIPPDRADLAERTEAMRELLDATVTTTRRISADLRPLVLDDLGLGAAAEWLAQGFAQRTQIACDLAVDAACAQLGEPHASALFRILQESLTNVARHARATRVRVTLERVGDDAVLTVTDDGVGMDPAARPGPRSFGLRGIGERVMLLGGEVGIASRPDAGTTIVARIPLVRAGAPAEAG